jgi:hypothetical protein
MTRVLLAVAVTALTCLAGGLAPDLAEAQRGGPDELIVVGSIGCAGNNCVDIWKVTCANAKTKTLCADACDTVGHDDTMVVVIAGATPAAVVGKGDISSGLNCASSVCVTRTVPGPITATVAISVTADSSTNYDSSMVCRDKNGADLPGPTATLVTSQ